MAGNGRAGRGSSREGEVSIKYNPHDDKPAVNKVGEYVDYEDVED